MFPNMLNQCPHNCDRFLVGYFSLSCHFYLCDFTTYQQSDFLLPIQSDSNGTENSRLLPAIKQLLFNLYVECLVAKCKSIGSHLKYVQLLAVYVYRFFFMYTAGSPLTLLMCRDRKPVLFWEDLCQRA